jgi:beta-lactamase regulating signal transducer with metallopeptidase domain
VRLLATSAQTVVLIAAVWALCRYVPRLSPATQCWLWWLVALQALVGLLAKPVQLPWLSQAPGAFPGVASTSWGTFPLDGVMLRSAGAIDVLPWLRGLFLLWMSGLAVTTWLTVRNWRRVRDLLGNSAPCIDAQLLQSLMRTCEAQGLRRVPHLRCSQDIDSPLVLGHCNPMLLLPAGTGFESEELGMIFAHELAHLRRGDLWWGWVPALVRHLFFFHPFAHFAVREYGIAREAACDAAVVELDRHSRHDYGRLLLRLGTCPRSDSGFAVGSRTFHALSRRLAMLDNTRFLPGGRSIALLTIVAAVGVMPLRLVAATTEPSASATSSAADAVPIAALTPRYTGEHITVNFQDLDVRALLRLIAEVSHRNIVVADSVKGSITLRLNDVPWDQVLDIVLKTKGLAEHVQDDVIYIAVAQ